MWKAVGEGGIEEEEQEGPNLNHESSPSLETNLERKRDAWEVEPEPNKFKPTSLPWLFALCSEV